LGIESSFALLASGAAKHDVRPRLVGITTTLTVDSLRAALAARGYTGEVTDDVLRLFSGRPRFGMRLAEALILQKPVESAAKDIVLGFDSVLQKLKTTPFTSAANSKSMYGEFRFAAMEWVLKGQGGVLRYGHTGLEQGICAISTQRTHGSATSFVIEEPLVTRAFADLPEADFEGINRESDAEIGHMFEDYTAFHAQELCDALDARQLGKIDDVFRGPWILAEPAGDERRGTLCRDGEEPARIHDMLALQEGHKGWSLVFPGTAMGADLVIVARRRDNRRLLLFVQTKACLKKSTTEALLSLRWPYHQNRGTPLSRNVPPKIAKALKALQNAMFNDQVSVVFMVFKYPANSKTTERAKKYTYTEVMSGTKSRAQPRTKECLEVVVDKTNAQTLLTDMKAGLDAMEDVKKMRRELFVDE
jgi:hypothetical protein